MRSGRRGDRESRLTFAQSAVSEHEGALERLLERAVRSIEQRGRGVCIRWRNPRLASRTRPPSMEGAVPHRTERLLGLGLTQPLCNPLRRRRWRTHSSVLTWRCWVQRQDHHRSGGLAQGQVWPERPSCGAYWHGGVHVDAQHIEGDVRQGQRLAGDDGHRSKTEG
jgi:hypothetical protein|uniref:Uncharacterized protein n=1 Tax=Zea mays TaxID=4577 RepID=A0A804UGL4_MAIZE